MGSSRLTDKWTKTATEAFGELGRKGELGEEFLYAVLLEWGWDPIQYHDDRDKQVAGIDMDFAPIADKMRLTCDVKNNMRVDGTFFVYADWLFKIQSDIVFHCHPESRQIAYYEVSEMRKYFTNTSNCRNYIVITSNQTPTFCHRKIV